MATSLDSDLRLATSPNSDVKMVTSIDSDVRLATSPDDSDARLVTSPDSDVMLETSPDSDVKMATSPDSGVRLETSPNSDVMVVTSLDTDVMLATSPSHIGNICRSINENSACWSLMLCCWCCSHFSYPWRAGSFLRKSISNISSHFANYNQRYIHHIQCLVVWIKISALTLSQSIKLYTASLCNESWRHLTMF